MPEGNVIKMVGAVKFSFAYKTCGSESIDTYSKKRLWYTPVPLCVTICLVSMSENAIGIPLTTMEKLSKTKRIFALHVELYKYRKSSSREGIS